MIYLYTMTDGWPRLEYTLLGSWVCPQAICLNKETQLVQAIAVAPRAERAQHLLVVSAGEMRLGGIFQDLNGVTQIGFWI